MLKTVSSSVSPIIQTAVSITTPMLLACTPSLIRRALSAIITWLVATDRKSSTCEMSSAPRAPL
jgi:hypothetical protein